MSQPAGGYRFYEDEKYGKAAVIDVDAEVASRAGEWFNQTLTLVNDAVVRLAVMNGEYHWHSHAAADEFFLVLDGELIIDIEGQDPVALGRHCGYAVPKGITHRTRTRGPSVALVIESAATAPAGD